MKPQPALHGAAFKTPMGTLVALASARGVCEVGFDLDRLADARQEAAPALDAFARWLVAYLARDFERLPEVPLDLQGSAAALSVWEALQQIPVGRTLSYGALAQRIGRPGAARAVGSLVGRNPVAILVPCHRVIAASGSLHGYASGVQRKAWLLKHEGALLL